MSQQQIKRAFLVEMPDGKLKWIDIGVCANCGGIHIPAEDAEKCEVVNYPTYEELKEMYSHTTNKRTPKPDCAQEEKSMKPCRKCGKMIKCGAGGGVFDDMCENCYTQLSENCAEEKK